MAIKDLVVLLSLLSLLPAALGVVVDRQKEIANRVRCAKNLQEIGMGLMMYANENRGAFPRTRYQPTQPPTAFTNWKQPVPNPYRPDGPQPNDVSATLYLLATTQEVAISSFICPSSSALPINFGQKIAPETPTAGTVAPDIRQPAGERIGERAAELTNFPSVANLSYSVANPYPSSAAVTKGYRWDFRLNKGLALAADINPGTEEVVAAKVGTMPAYLERTSGPAPSELSAAQLASNSPNHSGLGQNILFADGHVEFQPTPFAGIIREGRGRDNIYTRHFDGARSANSGDPILGSPNDAEDSVLLPTAKKSK